MNLLHLDQLELGDIISVPITGLVYLKRIDKNLGLDGRQYGLRYIFYDLDNEYAVGIPNSGCYGPYLFFSPFPTLHVL